MPSGAIQPWSELSGAQSVAVALAVRLGLAEVGGAAQGIHYETLYLDEADAWLTGDYQQQFMDMLAKVADTGIDVVAITHIEAVKQMVDQQVEVVSNGNESRIK
jgi:DNA repair exonuclease SbcCD ATPase subunit